VRAFIEAHGNSRFQSLVPRHDRGGNEFHERVIDRVGFKSVDPEGDTEFLILGEAFRQEVCRELDYRMVAKVLDKGGHLRTDSKGKRSVLHNLPALGRVRVYAVRASILGGEKAEQP
jgi:putative DNA primase/helicase